MLSPETLVCLQASERVPISVCGIHCTVTILAWVGVATAKGDYRYRPPNFLFGAQQKAMLLACFSGALTWVSNIHQSQFAPHPCLEPLLQVPHCTYMGLHFDAKALLQPKAE